MCSKRVEAWNKLIIKFSASSWLILINKYIEMHGQQNIKKEKVFTAICVSEIRTAQPLHVFWRNWINATPSFLYVILPFIYRVTKLCFLFPLSQLIKIFYLKKHSTSFFSIPCLLTLLLNYFWSKLFLCNFRHLHH